MFSKKVKKFDKINFCGLLRKHELYKIALTSFKFNLFQRKANKKLKVVVMDSLTTEYFQVVLHKFILIKSVNSLFIYLSMAIGNHMIMLVCQAFFCNEWIFDVDNLSMLCLVALNNKSFDLIIPVAI